MEGDGWTQVRQKKAQVENREIRMEANWRREKFHWNIKNPQRQRPFKIKEEADLVSKSKEKNPNPEYIKTTWNEQKWKTFEGKEVKRVACKGLRSSSHLHTNRAADHKRSSLSRAASTFHQLTSGGCLTPAQQLCHTHTEKRPLAGLGRSLELLWGRGLRAPTQNRWD